MLFVNAGLAAAEANSSAAVKKGGQLSLADIGLSWSSLDPQATSGTTAAVPQFSPMFEGLFTVNAAGTQVEPQLATSYTISPNHLSIEIKLRRGVHFQDGTQFNAAAVVFDIQRMASPTVNSQCAPELSTLTGVVADNNYEVTLNFSSPYGAIIDDLAGLHCALVVSPTAVQTEGSSAGQFGAHPVGTGPYEFTSEVVGSDIIWTRWGGYWNKAQRGNFSTIELTSIGSDQSCLAGVEATTIQICVGGTANDALSVRHIKSVQTYKGLTTAVENIAFNQVAPPFNNVNARKAVTQAIDVPVLLKELYGNEVDPTESYLTPSNWAFAGNRVRGYPQYSLSQAKADVAKLPGGTLSFTLGVTTVSGQLTLAEAVQSELLAAGINMQINELASTTLFADTKVGNFQAVQTTTNNYPDPDDVLYFQFDSTSPNNEQRVNIAGLDSLLVQARETFSRPQREALYLKAEQSIAENDTALMLFPVPNYYFLSRQLRGFSEIGNGTLSYGSMYLA